MMRPRPEIRKSHAHPDLPHSPSSSDLLISGHTLRIATAAAILALLAADAGAAEIKVIGSPGFREAYTALVPGFEKAAAHNVVTVWGGVNDVARRVAEGETADIVILPAAQIDGLIASGRLMADSRVDLAKSGVGAAIRAGAAKIDVGSSEALKRAILAAKSIAYSTGPSGAHMARLIANWGIADAVKERIVIAPPDTPVGEVLARGQAEIGFQQVSELLHAKGVDYLGPLPSDIQEITQFSAAVHKDARAPDAAKALVKFLSAPEAAPAIRNTGMDPG